MLVLTMRHSRRHERLGDAPTKQPKIRLLEPSVGKWTMKDGAGS